MAAVQFPAICILACSASAHCRFLEGDYCLSKKSLRSQGRCPIITTEPQILLDEMFFVSGEIPWVTSYEKGFPGHKRLSEDCQSWEDDPFIMDERFLAAYVRGERRCRLHGVLTRWRHKCAQACSILLPVNSSSCRRWRFPLGGRQREDHRQICAGYRYIWTCTDRSRPLHRLACS